MNSETLKIVRLEYDALGVTVLSIFSISIDQSFFLSLSSIICCSDCFVVYLMLAEMDCTG